MERKNHFPLTNAQPIPEHSSRELVSTIRGKTELKVQPKMQPSPNSPLTLPKQEENSSGSYDGHSEEGRFIDDMKSDGNEKGSFTGKKFNFDSLCSKLYLQLARPQSN